MSSPGVVQTQLAFFRDIVDGVVAAVPSEALFARIDGSTIGSAASTYVHMVTAEDMVVHSWYLNKPTVFESGGWAAKFGVTELGGMRSLAGPDGPSIDVPLFQQYAKAVYAATDAFLAGLTEADLQTEVRGPNGQQPLADSLPVMLGSHYLHHAGEVSALVGVQGQKGLPF